MENYLKENLKNLITLRTSLITVLIVITSGILGILILGIPTIKHMVLFCLGLYFDILFLLNLVSINNKIDNNIRRFLDD